MSTTIERPPAVVDETAGEFAPAPFDALHAEMQIPNLADHECRHGRLPIDHTPPCGCWPQELDRLIEMPAADVETQVLTQEPADLDELPPDIDEIEPEIEVQTYEPEEEPIVASEPTPTRETIEIHGVDYIVGAGPGRVSPMQAKVVTYLTIACTGPKDTSEIAYALELDQGRAASLLGGMEKRGFITGERIDGHRKAWKLERPATFVQTPARTASKSKGQTPDLLGVLDAKIAEAEAAAQDAQARVERLRSARETVADEFAKSA